MTQSPFSGGRFRRAIRFFVVGRAAQAIATLIVTLMALRLLDPVGYGVYMILWGLVELGSPLTSLGLLPAVQRFLPELAERGTPQRLRRFVAQLLVVRISLILVGALAVVLAWPHLSAWMGSADTRPSVAWLGAGMLTCVLVSRFSAEMLECLLEQRYAQTARALLPFLRGVGFLALWASGHASLLTLLSVDLLAAISAMTLGEVWLAKSVRAQRPDGEFQVSRQELVQFVWHMSGAQLLNAVSSVGTLRLVVARLLGVEVAGQFSFLQQLITIANRYLPSVMLANMVRPMLIARHSAGRVDEVARGFGLLWKSNVALVWPGVPLMLLAGDSIIHLASGGRVRDAGMAMALMVVGLAARGQHQIVNMALQVFRYTGLVRAESLLSLLGPALLFAFAGQGLVGMALGVCIGLLLRGAVSLALLQRQQFRILLDWPGAARLMAALLLATVAAYGVQYRFGPWFAAAALLLLYGLGAWLSRPLHAQEFSLIERAAGRRARWLAGRARG